MTSQTPDMQAVLERLERLERQYRRLKRTQEGGLATQRPRVRAWLVPFFFALVVFGGDPQLLSQTVQTKPSSGSQTHKTPLAFGLEDGTPIKLRLQRTVSSADAQVDDQVDFDVLEEIQVNDVVVIPKGNIAWGTVTEAQAKRRMARGGKLNVNIDAVRLADGEKAALRAVKHVKGGGHTGAMTGAMVATGIIFFPAAPLFLFMHGKDITIPKGMEITAYVNGDMTLDPLKFGSKAGVSTEPSEQLSVVSIRSTPDGAEVSVDGKYVGSTPSTVRLTAGDHSITVEKGGYKTWQRTMTVSPGGSVTLDATLEKVP